MSARRQKSLLVVLVGAGVGLASPAGAELSKDVCDGLRAEKARLEAAGVPQAMEKGPEWAKANLGADRLRQIQRYIEVGEGLSFRCERALGQDARADDDDDAATPAAAAPPLAKPKPAAAASAKAAPKAPAADGGAPQTAEKPKPKPKPKSNDAFVPPGKAAAGGGLDGQAGRQGSGQGGGTTQ